MSAEAGDRAAASAAVRERMRELKITPAQPARETGLSRSGGGLTAAGAMPPSRGRA
jgi:hypothetical protein